MKKRILLIVLFLILNSIISLAELSENELNDIKNKINEKRDKIPSSLVALYGDITSVVTIDGIDYGAISKNGELIVLKKGKPENPTMEILISEQLLKDILNKKKTIGEALETNQIIYRPITFKSKTVYGIARLGNFINRVLGL
ncbi:hypothetical protein HY498_03645 [Candidatus Woesearchaeota archaeon]|nr:hypothetical protein [Candidatus Woesearchaeota archaeon]